MALIGGNMREKIAIVGMVILGLASLAWLGVDAKDVVVSVTSGLLGYLKGNQSVT